MFKYVIHMDPGTYTHSGPKSFEKLYNRYPPGVGIPPPHNGKRNTYEFLSGVGTPPPHNEKRNSNLEARHKTKRVLINVTK